MRSSSPRLIKICGVASPEDARFAVRIGAHQIGIIMHPGSSRYVGTAQAREIAQATHDEGGTAVAVFVDESAAYIRHVCAHCGIRHIQLHGVKAKQSLPALRNIFTTTFCLGVEGNGKVCEEELQQFRELGGKAEFLLFDYLCPGSGCCFNWEAFAPPAHQKWLLAGGLQVGNVSGAIQLLDPYGVDVSSGVEESGKGGKSRTLIKQFIRKVRTT